VSSSGEALPGGEKRRIAGRTTQSPWLTAKEAAGYVGCHEETIRRGYLSGHLKASRFGSRGRRIHLADLDSWVRNGARTR
jgi:excisionase family DNA binding protein